MKIAEMKRNLFVFIAITMLLSSCSLSLRRIESFFTADDPQDIFVRMPIELVSGYRLAQMKSSENFTLTSPLKCSSDRICESDMLASQINRIGWNNNFIVVEEQEKTQKVWKIIIVKTEYVYYCAEKTEIDMCKSYDEFKSLRTQAGVPDDVELRDVVDVYEELNANK